MERDRRGSEGLRVWVSEGVLVGRTPRETFRWFLFREKSGVRPSELDFYFGWNPPKAGSVSTERKVSLCCTFELTARSW